jgi:hypothetical protein
MREHLRTIRDWLRRYGATGVHLKHGGKHPRLIFDYRGRRRFFVCPSTPGDHRGVANARAELRRLLRQIRSAEP